MKRHALLALLVCSLPAPGQNYPYSIHPFGIHSIEQYREAKAEFHDHYAIYGAVHVAQLRRDLHRYVSYRNGNVYWTRTPLLIHAREYVWTDGKHYLRSRCGNRLSTLPMLPVEAYPPRSMEFDVPEQVYSAAPIQVDSAVLPWNPVSSLPSDLEQSAENTDDNLRTPVQSSPLSTTNGRPENMDTPLVLLPPAGGILQRHRHPVPVMPTPEPNTVPIVLLVIVLLAYRHERRSRHRSHVHRKANLPPTL